MELMRRYPAHADLRRKASRRVPGFAWEFFIGGIGAELCLQRNRAALDAIRLSPRYVRAPFAPEMSVDLMGRRYAMPFGVCPMGLTSLVWPGSERALAAAAKAANIPYGLSSFASATMEEIAEIAGPNAWFQHYVTNRPEIEADILARVRTAGYETLIVTVDIPAETKRDRDIRNGLSMPPKFDFRTVMQVAACPRWAWETWRGGIPQLAILGRYVPEGASMDERGAFMDAVMEGNVGPERLKQIRDAWPGKLVVKGVLGAADAEECRRIGADGIVVSNHGGRQLDPAPAPVEVLREVRGAAGPGIALIADSGVTSGFDIARVLAAGADFVMLGRAFLMGVAALGAPGAAHVVEILRTELRSTMGQIGAERVAEMPGFLAK